MRTNSFRYLLLSLTVVAVFLASEFLSAQQFGGGPGPGPGGGVAATTLTTFEMADFSGSGICAMCHSNLTDEAGNDVSNDAQMNSAN